MTKIICELAVSVRRQFQLWSYTWFLCIWLKVSGFIIYFWWRQTGDRWKEQPEWLRRETCRTLMLSYGTWGVNKRVCKDLKDLKQENGESFKHYKNYIKYSFRLSSFWLNLEIKRSMYWGRVTSLQRCWVWFHPAAFCCMSSWLTSVALQLSWHQKNFWRRQRWTFEWCSWYNLVFERSVAASPCSLLAAGASPHGTR